MERWGDGEMERNGDGGIVVISYILLLIDWEICWWLYVVHGYIQLYTHMYVYYSPHGSQHSTPEIKAFHPSLFPNLIFFTSGVSGTSRTIPRRRPGFSLRFDEKGFGPFFSSTLTFFFATLAFFEVAAAS